MRKRAQAFVPQTGNIRDKSMPGTPLRGVYLDPYSKRRGDELVQVDVGLAVSRRLLRVLSHLLPGRTGLDVVRFLADVRPQSVVRTSRSGMYAARGASCAQSV